MGVLAEVNGLDAVLLEVFPKGTKTVDAMNS